MLLKPSLLGTISSVNKPDSPSHSSSSFSGEKQLIVVNDDLFSPTIASRGQFSQSQQALLLDVSTRRPTRGDVLELLKHFLQRSFVMLRLKSASKLNKLLKVKRQTG